MKDSLLITLISIISICSLGNTVYLTDSDSISWGIKNDGSTAVVDSSWTNQLRWSDNALPGVDRNYVITDGKLLLSPLCEGWAAADYVYFGGGSLTLMPGATMGIVGGQNSNARGVVSNLYAHGGSTIFYSFEVQTGNMVSMPNSSLTLIGEQSGPPLKLAVTNLTDFWQQRGSMLRMPKISGKSNIEIKWHQGPERFNMIDNFGTHPPAYFSKRYSFEDLTEWSGNFSVLGGIRATEISRQPIAGINFVGNASLGSFSVAMTNSAMISFGSAIEGATTLNVTQPVTMPIDIGGESNWHYLVSEQDPPLVVSSPITGNGDLIVMGRSNNRIIFKNMNYQFGNITVTNCVLELCNTVLPVTSTVTVQVGALERSWEFELDPELSVIMDFTQEPLASSFSKEDALRTFSLRPAPLLLGTHRIAKLPEGTELAELTGLEPALFGNEVCQTEWLAEPIYDIDNEDYLTITLSERSDYITQVAEHSSSPWLTFRHYDKNDSDEYYWSDQLATHANAHYASAMNCGGTHWAGADFPGSSLTMHTGGTFFISLFPNIKYFYMQDGTFFSMSPNVQGLSGTCLALYGENNPEIKYVIRSRWPNEDFMTNNIPFFSHSDTTFTIDTSGSSSPSRFAGFLFNTPMPGYRGKIKITNSPTYSAAGDTVRVAALSDEALGSPLYFRSDALEISLKRTELATLPDHSLALTNQLRGITIRDNAALMADGAESLFAISSPISLTSGIVTNLGSGTLVLEGVATATEGTTFAHVAGTYEPRSGASFSSANLVIGADTTLRINRQAGDQELQQSGLVVRGDITIQGAFDLDILLKPEDSFNSGSEIPLLTASDRTQLESIGALVAPQVTARVENTALFIKPSAKHQNMYTLLWGYNAGTLIMIK